MLTADGCAARRARLWAALPAHCDALVLTTPESLVYFAGYAPSPFVFNGVEASAALVLLPDRSILLADNLMRGVLEKAHCDEVICLEWYAARTTAPPRGGHLAEALSRALPRLEAIRLGHEAMGKGALPSAERHVLDPLIRELRRSKDPDELALLRKSVAAGEAAHHAALAHVRPGMHELDLFLLVQDAATRQLGEPAQLYGDFVSGPRCELERGGPPSGRVIERGDLVLLDFSVVVSGYRADFTNSFVVGAEPTRRQQELYELCLGAMAAGESRLRPGTPGRDVDRAVRGYFEGHGVGRYFPSHSGHGLGLGHPEPPYLVPESTDTLRPGDVVALEPGLYIPGAGGMRFENNYLITDDGCQKLTNHRLALRP